MSDIKCSQCATVMQVTFKDHLWEDHLRGSITIENLEHRNCSKCGEEEQVFPCLGPLTDLTLKLPFGSPCAPASHRLRFYEGVGWVVVTNFTEAKLRIQARLAKIAKDKDDGVYAKAYVEDVKALLEALR